MFAFADPHHAYPAGRTRHKWQLPQGGSTRKTHEGTQFLPQNILAAPECQPTVVNHRHFPRALIAKLTVVPGPFSVHTGQSSVYLRWGYA